VHEREKEHEVIERIILAIRHSKLLVTRETRLLERDSIMQERNASYSSICH